MATRRVTLDLSEEAVAEVDRLGEILGISDRAKIIRFALALWKIVHEDDREAPGGGET